MKRLLLLSALLVPFHPVNAQPDADTNRTFQVELKVVSVPQGALASNAYTLTATAITVRSNRQWSLAGQVDDGVIVGQVPASRGGTAEEIGILLGQDSPLTACTSRAVEALRADGTLERLAQVWLAERGGAPVLS